jgi:hypothetical protein
MVLRYCPGISGIIGCSLCPIAAFFVGGAVGAVCFNGDVGDDGDYGGCEAVDIPTTCSPVTL